MTGGLDAGQPFGGRIREASFIVPPEILTQPLKLRAEIEVRGVRRPVNWACEQPTDSDGSFVIELQPHNAAGWQAVYVPDIFKPFRNNGTGRLGKSYVTP